MIVFVLWMNFYTRIKMKKFPHRAEMGAVIGIGKDNQKKEERNRTLKFFNPGFGYVRKEKGPSVKIHAV